MKPGQSHKEMFESGMKEWNRGGGQGPLAKERGLYLDISAGVPEFLVTPLLMRPSASKSQSAFVGRYLK